MPFGASLRTQLLDGRGSSCQQALSAHILCQTHGHGLYPESGTGTKNCFPTFSATTVGACSLGDSADPKLPKNRSGEARRGSDLRRVEVSTFSSFLLVAPGATVVIVAAVCLAFACATLFIRLQLVANPFFPRSSHVTDITITPTAAFVASAAVPV